MGDALALAGTALWLGILTSINPCPLATNIAAISYLGKDVDRPRRVFLGGLLYTLGRTITYVVLGALLVMGLVGAPGLSHFLSKYMNLALGPLLILVGLFLLDWISFGGSGMGVGEGFRKRIESWGLLGALLLGVVFALSLCPLSAAIFFLTLIPLAVKHGSSVLLPSLYGIGTALPVIAFAIVVAFGAGGLGKAYGKVTAFARWARIATGVVFVAAGLYLSLVYAYEVL